MEWLYTLFFGNGIAHAVLIFALVITIGILLGKVKIGGISLGVTWILFVGILFSHFGMTVNGEVRHFVQEFGLILCESARDSSRRSSTAESLSWDAPRRSSCWASQRPMSSTS